ncbi:MAG: hypothetical protein E5W72_17075 [Mesorhizobium sp.]|uniref:hypothetical protein n=1 Tax=Mesorhizobium sp. TaxID=1871066 RepID=UPI00121CC471|nr:hypothetical protein [Mesorhizobium sp.]TIS97145.1 MAG: hypothetical protein E5W87_27885 [Mesorhizobium sp.]TIT48846.1 MAG: hypothetical protein E5W72_17075 [Mesorhizobium sp.]
MKQKTALRRVGGANQHHAEINSIVAGTKQEQNAEIIEFAFVPGSVLPAIDGSYAPIPSVRPR